MIKEYLREIISEIKKRVVNGDYEFISCGVHTSKVRIDGLVFELWTNSGARNFGIYGSGSPLMKQIEDFDMAEDDKKKAWAIIEPKIKKHRNDILIKQHEEALAELRLKQ